MTASPLAEIFESDRGVREVLRERGYDVKKIHPLDYEQVLRDGTMPQRHPTTEVIYLDGMVPAPRLWAPRRVNGSAPADTLRTVRASDVVIRSIEWIEEPLLQGSAFTLIAGPKGCGKGTWLAKTAAKMTRGLYGPPRNVLFVSSEDSAAIDLVPRLKAAVADLDRVVIVTEHITLPADLDRIRSLAEEVGDVGLIVIDPIGNHMNGADTDKEGLVRNAIGGLNKLADDLSCAIFGVRHLGKNRQQGALAAILGSTAWVDLPRQVNVFARDDEDENVIHVQVAAGNRSAHGAGESFRIELRPVEGASMPVTYAAELGVSHKDVDELLAAPKRANSASKVARELILDTLESEGEQESDQFDARIAKQTGLAAGTVKNVRAQLGKEGLVKSVPDKDEHGAVKQWKVRRTQAVRT